MTKSAERWMLLETKRIGASTGLKSTGIKQAGNVYHRRVFGLVAAHCRVALPGWHCLIEPWFRCKDAYKERSPDIVLVHTAERVGIVIEVKLNWRQGRDQKLLLEYMPLVENALQLEVVWPLLITKNLRGYPHPPLLGLSQLMDCLSWAPGRPTPMMLLL